MKKTILITGIILIVSAGLLNAQTATPKVTKRQVDQQERIDQGVKDKELTKPEAAKLEREQKNIKTEKKIAKSDGVVTPKERKVIRHQQNHASKDIYKQKHDPQVR